MDPFWIWTFVNLKENVAIHATLIKTFSSGNIIFITSII